MELNNKEELRLVEQELNSLISKDNSLYWKRENDRKLEEEIESCRKRFFKLRGW